MQNEPINPRDCFFDVREFRYWDDKYGDLEELIQSLQEPEIIAHLRILVPEYNPPGSGRRQPVEMVPASRSGGLLSVS